jgi:AcrR family transcriptional regulator
MVSSGTATKQGMTTRTRDVVDRGRWITEGLAILGAEGVASVRVEVLAKRLGVTKGSFYWHFKDRSDLLEGMLEEWRRSTTTAVVESLWGKPISPYDKLVRLWRMCFSSRLDNPGGPLEAALRQWSLADERVSRMMHVVDQERTTFVSQIYRDIGVSNPESYALLWYAYVVGRNTMATQGFQSDASQDAAIRDVLLVSLPNG